MLALEQREIVSQAPVSVIAPYHTALIVVAAASAFIICVLTLLVLLYRRKVSSSLSLFVEFYYPDIKNNARSIQHFDFV